MKRVTTSTRAPRKTKKTLSQEAYDLLRIEAADVDRCPRITPYLESAGVLSKVWEFLEMSEDPASKKLIAMKMRMPTKAHVSSVPFEAYCLAAGVSTKAALGVVTAEVFAQTEQTALLTAAAAHPDIVKATIEAAKDPRGSKERDMLLKHSGFVPVPKTSIVNVHGGRNVIGEQKTQVQQNVFLPSIENTIKQVGNRFNEQSVPALEAGEAFDVEPEGEDEDDGDDDEA